MSVGRGQEKKQRLHSRNKNRERYDLKALQISNPELAQYIKINKYGMGSIDFSNPTALKILNRALLNYYYGIEYWEFPDENLCPPIPGRADYIHHVADVLAENNLGTIPTGEKITCLDIGVGASCIYPIIGVIEYGWKFIGSDIDSKSVTSAQNIIRSNSSLKNKIELRLQKNPKNIFYGILDIEDKIDLTVCNPPFHASFEEAQKESRRKVKNLSGRNEKNPTRNFAGISNELICDGGEYKFIKNIIRESEKFSKSCYWFSTLVSKQSNVKGISKLLEQAEVNQIKVIPMGVGNKSSRIIAWTFLNTLEKKEWRDSRWKKKSAY